jgi:hypothetical protein
MYFLFSFFLAQITYGQSQEHQDSLALEYVWSWSQTDTIESAYYFRRVYTYPLQPCVSYTYKGYRIFHFPDRCSDNMVVLDTESLKVVDMCVGECEWLEKLEHNVK